MARHISEVVKVQRARGFFFATALLVLFCPGAPGQSVEFSGFLQRVFDSEEFTVRKFGPAQWTDGGAAYTALEKSEVIKDRRDIVRYETTTGKRKVLVSASQLMPPGAISPLAIEDYAWSSNNRRVLLYTNSKKIWRQNTRGDYWVLDLETSKLQKIAGDAASSTMFAKFSPDGTRVAYVRANNIYVEDLHSGAITQLTFDGSSTTINGTSDWVNEEEFDIRDGFRWSPDGKNIAYWQFDSAGVGVFALINNTDSAYPVITHFPYPTVGTVNSAVRVGVVRPTGGTTLWMGVPGDPRNNYIARMEWADNSDDLVLQHLNRLQNSNEVLLADARSGAVRQIYRDGDKAWLDLVNDLKWFDGGRQFTWLSEQDGWRHAYAISRDGNREQLVTTGASDVISVKWVDEHGKWLYYIASPENASQRYLYRIKLDGKAVPERLSPADAQGTHSYDISPDGRWAFHTYSRFDQPPTVDLVSLPEHEAVRVFEDNASLRASIGSLVDPPTEFFQIHIGDGVTLDGWMIRPKSFDANRKYPLLMFVYGEPAAQAVLDEWPDKTGLFHRALANEGYVIACVDNRGTPAPKGRAWRKIIYGTIGVLSSEEQAAAVRALAEVRSYIDINRVAVWGWSGGGSNTLNLMFRSPDLYKVGISVAPVPDQRLYDTIYQERYMGLPKDNPEGYRNGSPINFAQGLKGKLLLVHGTGDDNVHFQGSQLLMNELIELGKPFDFMEYPNRTHSLSEGKGSLFHLYNLLGRYLEEHLPAGPMPR